VFCSKLQYCIAEILLQQRIRRCASHASQHPRRPDYLPANNTCILHTQEKIIEIMKEKPTVSAKTIAEKLNSASRCGEKH